MRGKKAKQQRKSLQVSSSTGKTKGCVTTKTGSSRLYFDFYRCGIRTEISSGLTDTLETRKDAVRMLRCILDDIEGGGFCFSEAFPGASPKMKAVHSQMDNRLFSPQADKMTFGLYVEGKGKGGADGWLQRVLSTYPSETTRDSYRQAIGDRLLPFFRDMTFHSITGIEVQRFIASLTWRDTYKAGTRLSSSRIRNVLTPLRVIFDDACEENHWQLPDPFLRLSKKNVIPKKKKNIPRVFRLAEWQCLVDCMDPFYRPIAELMLLTGMIGSELAGLRKSDIETDYMYVRNKVVENKEAEELKTTSRPRRIPLTLTLRRILNVLLERAEGNYVLTMHDGNRYSHTRFKDNVWEPAFKKAGLAYVRPYAARHTFAAWLMTIGMDINKLERLMGHGSKQMLYETYGKYTEGLEDDREKILKYFGRDFLGRGKVLSLTKGEFFGESFSESYSESHGESAFVARLNS